MFTVLKTGLGALLLILLKSVTLYMPDTYRGQKRALDSLKLELNMIVRYHGDQTQVPWKSSQCSNH